LLPATQHDMGRCVSEVMRMRIGAKFRRRSPFGEAESQCDSVKPDHAFRWNEARSQRAALRWVIVVGDQKTASP